MGYTKVGLEDKILEMYPEIRELNISLSLNYSEEKNSFIVKLKKDGHELDTLFEKSVADECMNGVKCVRLGIKIGEFIKNFKSEE
jgi:hypothetical protein